MSPELEAKLARRGSNILVSQKRWDTEATAEPDELCRIALDSTSVDTLQGMYVRGTLELGELEECLDLKLRLGR